MRTEKNMLPVIWLLIFGTAACIQDFRSNLENKVAGGLSHCTQSGLSVSFSQPVSPKLSRRAFEPRGPFPRKNPYPPLKTLCAGRIKNE